MVLLSLAEPTSLKLPESTCVQQEHPRIVQEIVVRQTSANCSLYGAGACCKSSLCLPPVASLHFFPLCSFFSSLCLTFWGLGAKLRGTSIIDNLRTDLCSLQMERVLGCPLSEQPKKPNSSGESIIAGRKQLVSVARGRMAHS